MLPFEVQQVRLHASGAAEVWVKVEGRPAARGDTTTATPELVRRGRRTGSAGGSAERATKQRRRSCQETLQTGRENLYRVQWVEATGSKETAETRVIEVRGWDRWPTKWHSG